jgi:hypothetical protein
VGYRQDTDTVGEFKITQECDHEMALCDRQSKALSASSPWLLTYCCIMFRVKIETFNDLRGLLNLEK